MEQYKEESMKSSKTSAVVKCCIILLLIALFVCLFAEIATAQETRVAPNDMRAAAERTGEKNFLTMPALSPDIF